jgi:hypothetical protein
MAVQGLGFGAAKRAGLQSLLEIAQSKSPTIAAFSTNRLRQFRELRNRITHQGFISSENSESISLFLEVGLPLLEASYRDFYSYDLMDGLLQNYVEQLYSAKEVLRLAAKGQKGCDLSYCMNAFGQLVRWSLKDGFSAGWELEVLIHGDETGLSFERMHREKEKLSRLFGAYWTFDCPVCGYPESAICELDDAELDFQKVVPKRLGCTSCGFVVKESHFYLSEVLLRKQVGKVHNQVLEEYGLA